jgi:glycosyltransferase involved in cell wall biosynthesis
LIKKKIFSILYAPGVHTGGGWSLLQAVITISHPKNPLRLFLDSRVANIAVVPKHVEVYWIRPTIFARLAAEWRLFLTTNKVDTVICFSSLPPLFPSNGNIVVFQQNIILLKKSTLSLFSLRKEIKFMLMRFFSIIFKKNIKKFIVQTPSMFRAVRNWYGHDIKVSIIPFSAHILLPLSSKKLLKKRQGFVYIADGSAHKNHHHLLEAWLLLAKCGYRPKLLLTISSQNKFLLDKIDYLRRKEGLRIYNNKKRLNQKDIMKIYSNAEALIFPSFLESLGLPLIEASQINLPIIASELDFVREVCKPAQTFDPHSSISIMQAVLRFMGKRDPLVKLQSPEKIILKKN